MDYDFHRSMRREVSVPVATKEGADETGKAATMEVRTVKKTLDYVPFKAAWSDVDYSRLNRKSWKRIQPHIVLMKSQLHRLFLPNLSLIR